jgi:CelD/BcsL family acetyltransferase involved in cellulose biosynthesis
MTACATFRHWMLASRHKLKSVDVTVVDLPQRDRPARSPFKVEIYDGGNLAGAHWPALASDRDLNMYIYQSREFLDIWWRTIGKAGGIETYLVVVRDHAGQPVMYLPLAIETRFNIRLLRFMDYGVADYNAPILADGYKPSPQEFGEVWSQVLARLPGFDVVDLKKVASDVCGAFNPLTYLDCTPFGQNGHALRLTTGAGTATTSTIPLLRLRRRLDRNYGEISEIGEPTFVVNPADARSELVTEKLFELKRRKYAQTQLPDFLAAPGVAEFYRQIVTPQRNGKIGQLSALMIGDTVISAHIGFVGAGRFYYILPAYDAAFARYSPGHLLLRYLIDRSAAQGIETFDLGVGDDHYKATWATHTLALYCHERAMTAAGQVYLQMRRVRRFVKTGGLRTWFRPAS